MDNINEIFDAWRKFTNFIGITNEKPNKEYQNDLAIFLKPTWDAILLVLYIPVAKEEDKSLAFNVIGGIYIKDTDTKKFIIIDAAMNNLIRPALYGAKHSIIPSKKNNLIIKKKHEFVGPICETSDKFSTYLNYQKINQKDNLVICDVGAYGTVLSSNYNLRPHPPEILVKNKNINIIKKRQKLSDLIN